MKNLGSFLEENEDIQKMMELKSNLILEAEWLKASGDLDEAKKNMLKQPKMNITFIKSFGSIDTVKML